MRGGGASKSRAGTALYADLDQLLAWFAAARPGGPMVRWASGRAIDPAHPAAVQVADWIAAGSAAGRTQPMDAANPDNGEFVWLVGKVACGHRAGTGAADPQPALGGKTAERKARLIALLLAAAKAGAPRPSYSEMARMLGLRNREAARHLYRQLANAGALSGPAFAGMLPEGAEPP